VEGVVAMRGKVGSARNGKGVRRHARVSRARVSRRRTSPRPQGVEVATLRPSDDRDPQQLALLSGTAVAAAALRTGVSPSQRRRKGPLNAREDETIRFGDPDDDPLANEYVGDETPGGSAPTPDQSVIDEIGRAYGLQEEDVGDLRSAAEILARRDRHRAELRPPRGSVPREK
jgi:hypothetical protein